MASRDDTARALLDRHGRTFAEELGLDVAEGTPSVLFRLLCAATLMSARISSQIAAEAAAGWRGAAGAPRGRHLLPRGAGRLG